MRRPQTPEELRGALTQLDRMAGGSQLALLTTGTFSAQDAFDRDDTAEGLGWVEATIAVARELASRGLLDEWDATAKIVRLSAVALHHHLDDQQRDRLDLDRLLADVTRLLPADPGETAQRARRWQELPRAEILQLRRIKQLIYSLTLLEQEQGHPDVSRIIAPWREVLPLLP